MNKRFAELQLREEIEGFLSRLKKASDEKDAGGGAKAAEREDARGVSDEVAKLQGLVEDLQQQLGRQHQDMQGWLQGVDKRLEAVVAADAGAMEKRDFLVAMLMAVRRDGFDSPRLACLLPPWPFENEAHGLSENEQKPEVWFKRFKEWQADDFKEGKGFFKKKKLLFLVCAHTHRLVPCGPNGRGYELSQPRTWLRMSVSVVTFALQVMFSTLTAIAAAPASGVGAAFEATVSTMVEGFQSMLEDQLAALAINDDGAAVDVEPQAMDMEPQAANVGPKVKRRV